MNQPPYPPNQPPQPLPPPYEPPAPVPPAQGMPPQVPPGQVPPPPFAPPPYPQPPYPQAPYAQAPYAQAPYPQSAYPQPLGPPAPKSGHTVRNVSIIAAVVVIVVAVGLTFALRSATAHHGSGTPSAAKSGGKMTVAWTHLAPEGTELSLMNASWLSAKTVVEGRGTGLTGYSLAKGAKAWGWQAPSGHAACAMSPTTSNGIGVLAYGSGTGHCDQLMALDVDSGKQLWPHAINVANVAMSAEGKDDPFISLDGNTMAVMTPDDTLGAYNLTTGAQLWKTTNSYTPTSSSCLVRGTASVGSTVYALDACETADFSSYISLLGYDAKTGKQNWTGHVSQVDGDDEVSLWSDPADGYIFLADSTSDPDHTILLSFSVPGGSGPTTATSIPLDSYNTEDTFNILTAQRQHLPHGYAIHGHTLYIQGPDSDDGVNSVNAVDLKTGKRLWTQKITGTQFTILGADASGVHAVESEPGSARHQVVTFSGSTGSKTNGASVDDRRIHFLAQDMIYLKNGRLVDLAAVLMAGDLDIFVLNGAA